MTPSHLKNYVYVHACTYATLESVSWAIAKFIAVSVVTCCKARYFVYMDTICWC